MSINLSKKNNISLTREEMQKMYNQTEWSGSYVYKGEKYTSMSISFLAQKKGVSLKAWPTYS